MPLHIISDYFILALTGIGAIAFFFLRSYLNNLTLGIKDLTDRYDKIYEKIDCRLTTIEITLAVKSNTLDNYVKDLMEIKQRLKDRVDKVDTKD